MAGQYGKKMAGAWSGKEGGSPGTNQGTPVCHLTNGSMGQKKSGYASSGDGGTATGAGGGGSKVGSGASKRSWADIRNKSR